MISMALWSRQKTQSKAAMGYVRVQCTIPVTEDFGLTTARVASNQEVDLAKKIITDSLFLDVFVALLLFVVQAKFHAVCSFPKFCEILERLNPTIPDTLCRTIFDQALEYLHEVMRATLLLRIDLL